MANKAAPTILAGNFKDGRYKIIISTMPIMNNAAPTNKIVAGIHQGKWGYIRGKANPTAVAPNPTIASKISIVKSLGLVLVVSPMKRLYHVALSL